MTGHTDDAAFSRQALTAMAGHGVDTRDAGAVRAWLRRAHRQRAARPGPAREAAREPLPHRWDESPVRPVRLEPESELAALARGTETLAGLYELADWAERHRPAWTGGRPEPDAARAAARGLAVFGGAGHGDGLGPEALRFWRAAFDAGLVTLVSGRVRRAPGGASPATDPDPLVLRRWLAVGTAVTAVAGTGEDRARADHDGRRVAQRVLDELVFELYQCGRGVHGRSEVARLAAEAISDAVVDGVVPEGRAPGLRAAAEAAAHAALARLVRHGAVVACPGGDVEIGPLGRWGVNRLVNEAGLRAPVLGGYARADAGELVAVLSGYSESERAVELLGWLGARTPEEAAADLLAVAAKADTGRRGMAVAVLRRIGPAAERAVRAGLDDPLTWRHCERWLGERGFDTGRDLTDPDRAWLLVESVVGLSHQRGPQDYVRLIGRLVGEREIPLVALLADLDHPDRARALELLFELHPDPRVSVAARYACSSR
ncbi:hypothetical protein [Actinorugispora endophytica]|uniref:Uncharacterized protein n=1 Tax=Actinorugispora endophytica TaxID=1605990 RepID=A0A4R6V1U7_9ACTN|nr:hypothetical protein [Actinorugispora endophytica]TDQ52561.1 hypothetical protein EV190_106201 [Actinorugispora endophytica]